MSTPTFQLTETTFNTPEGYQHLLDAVDDMCKCPLFYDNQITRYLFEHCVRCARFELRELHSGSDWGYPACGVTGAKDARYNRTVHFFPEVLYPTLQSYVVHVDIGYILHAVRWLMYKTKDTDTFKTTRNAYLFVRRVTKLLRSADNGITLQPSS